MRAPRDRDKIVICHFLRGYYANANLPFPEVTFPDKSERETESIDALACWGPGQTFAVEHTLVQAFPDEKFKLKGQIGRVFEPFCSDPSVALPGYHIWLKVPLDGLPGGASTVKVARSVREWFVPIRESLLDGFSEARVSGLGFDLPLVIYKQFLKQGAEGKVSVTYFAERVEGALSGVIRKALGDKLCKLRKFQAKERFLIFEMDIRAYTSWDVRRCLDFLRNDFPGLSQIDAVWVVDTSEIRRQGRIFCSDVWPGDVGARFFAVDWAGDEPGHVR